MRARQKEGHASRAMREQGGPASRDNKASQRADWDTEQSMPHEPAQPGRHRSCAHCTRPAHCGARLRTASCYAKRCGVSATTGAAKPHQPSRGVSRCPALTVPWLPTAHSLQQRVSNRSPQCCWREPATHVAGRHAAAGLHGLNQQADTTALTDCRHSADTSSKRKCRKMKYRVQQSPLQLTQLSRLHELTCTAHHKNGCETKQLRPPRLTALPGELGDRRQQAA